MSYIILKNTLQGYESIETMEMIAYARVPIRKFKILLFFILFCVFMQWASFYYANAHHHTIRKKKEIQ